jgi:hypothetical protein
MEDQIMEDVRKLIKIFGGILIFVAGVMIVVTFILGS